MATVVTDAELSRLLEARPARIGAAQAFDAEEQASGVFDPTPEVLRKAIDAVFWASLSAEEGKSALTRLRFADVREPQCRLSPTDVTPAALRKLSPLMDEPLNVLYIRKDAQIVGVGTSSDGVGVEAHRPGHLAVLDESVVLGVLEQGTWVRVGRSETNLANILQSVLPPEDSKDRFSKATLVMRLASTAWRTGRGAMFAIVPADRQSGIGTISYPVEAFPALPQALEAWRRANRSAPSKPERRQTGDLVNNARAVVGAGAGIDGATLIDDANLRLLGFGAKVNVPDDEEEVCLFELPDESARMILKKDLGGMRHQTAARLVQHNHDATVITVSQDGPISLFTWNHDRDCVAVFKHLDRYLMASNWLRE